MLWRIYQLAVFFGVYALFVENGWTKDLGAAPLVVSVAAAWLATALPLAIIDLSRRCKALLFRRHQGADDRGAARVKTL